LFQPCYLLKIGGATKKEWKNEIETNKKDFFQNQKTLLKN
jgi:hypothetical protein